MKAFGILHFACNSRCAGKTTRRTTQRKMEKSGYKISLRRRDLLADGDCNEASNGPTVHRSVE